MVLREGKENIVNGKQKDSVRVETSVVSATTGLSVQKPHQKPVHPLNHQHKEMVVRRGKRTLKAGVHLGSLLDILPNVSFATLNGAVNSVMSVPLHTGRLKVNPARNRKKRMVTKVQWPY